MNQFSADYVIVCAIDYPGDTRVDIVTDALVDCGLKNNEDFYVFEEEAGVLEKINIANDDQGSVSIGIKFPQNRIDMIAGIKKIYGDLDVAPIRVPYDEDMQDEFTAFDARQKITSMALMLADQIDFDWLEKAGIIKEHYPLHEVQNHEDLQESVGKYSCKLCCSLITCGKFGNRWEKYA